LGNFLRNKEAILAKDIPLVCKALLDDPHQQGPLIPLDTPAWFAWLEAPTTTHFSYAFYNHAGGYIDGFMTVRKERRQRGGTYWSVYRRQNRRLRKLYLGASSALTYRCLEEIAARLRHSTPDASPEPH
jgi:hypothetical protein